MNNPKRLTQEVFDRILKIARDNPDLTLREIGSRFSPKFSNDTIGRVLRGQTGPTVGPDGKMIRPTGFRKGPISSEVQK